MFIRSQPKRTNWERNSKSVILPFRPCIRTFVRSVTQHSHNAILNASRAHTKITSFLNKKKQQHKNTNNNNNNERATERKAKERSYRAKVPWRPLNGINQQQQHAREEYKFKCEHWEKKHKHSDKHGYTCTSLRTWIHAYIPPPSPSPTTTSAIKQEWERQRKPGQTDGHMAGRMGGRWMGKLFGNVVWMIVWLVILFVAVARWSNRETNHHTFTPVHTQIHSHILTNTHLFVDGIFRQQKILYSQQFLLWITRSYNLTLSWSLAYRSRPQHDV